MNSNIKQIGFSQRIRIEWLEQTANLVLAGNEISAIREVLNDLLQEKLSVGSAAKRGNRGKSITILMKIWLTVPRGLEMLRDDSLEIFKKLPRENHIAIHWGMTMAVYPFWAAVAAHTGRLLRLQGTLASAHVQRRVQEQYGERSTVKDATRRVLRSFHDWGVLEETDNKGVYKQKLSLHIDNPKLIAWLIQAFLHTRTNRSATISELLDSTSLFPFRLARLSTENLINSSSCLELLHHGLDDDMVMLRDK